MNNPATLRPICLILAVVTMVIGGLGMAASFLFLSSSGMGDVMAGTSGLIAGAILIGAGLLSMTMMAARPIDSDPKKDESSEFI